MKWRDLMAGQMDRAAAKIRQLSEEDAVGLEERKLLRCVARRLDREAKRRQEIAFGLRMRRPRAGRPAGETCAECGEAIEPAKPEDDLAPGAYVHRTGDDKLDCDLGGSHDARPEAPPDPVDAEGIAP